MTEAHMPLKKDNGNRRSTISIAVSTRKQLKTFKQYRLETYDEVLLRLMELARTLRDNEGEKIKEIAKK